MDNQPIQSTMPPTSPSNSSKTFLIMGAIVLMAVSTAGGYYLGTNKQPQTFPSDAKPKIREGLQTMVSYSPTPTPLTIPTVDPSVPANWKELTLGELNFKVPKDWWTEEQKYTTDGFSFININPTKLGGGDAPSAFMIYQNTDITLEQKRTELKNNFTNSNESQVVVAGGQGFLIQGTTKPGYLPALNTRRLVFSYKDSVYSFLELDMKSDLSKYFDQILSTFQFSN